MVGWHHRLNGHAFEQSPEDGEGQESLACCSPWGRKGSDSTEQLNNREQQGGGSILGGRCRATWPSPPAGPEVRSQGSPAFISSPRDCSGLGPCQPDVLPPLSLSSMKYTFTPGLFLFHSFSVQLPSQPHPTTLT